MFKPKAASQMTTPIKLKERVVTKVSGAKNIVYQDATDPVIYCNFKTFGGTERVINNLIVIDNTATITTWYRPDIKANCQIELLSDNSIWEIINDPENIEQRNQMIQFKVRKVTGGA